MSRLLSALYYFVFSKSFYREFQFVLAGKAKYIKENATTNSNYYQLVRNTHRIEKGLLMRPRRDIFAKEYIKDTVDSYIGVLSKESNLVNKQLIWFTDVLAAYFQSVGSDSVIDKQRTRYTDSAAKKLNGSYSNEDPGRYVPYLRDAGNRSGVSYTEFYKLCMQRRSVRWSLKRSVPRDLIDKAILAAIQAPSACNRQPFEFRIIDDPALVPNVVSLPMGTGGYAHNIPVMIVVVGNLNAYFSERDRHLIYIDASLANMALMLAFETLGLSSCPINWPDIEEREKRMEKFLKLQPYQRPIMCLGVGYADDEEGMVARSEKRTLENIRRYN
jgi:nitroreductase